MASLKFCSSFYGATGVTSLKFCSSSSSSSRPEPVKLDLPLF